MKWLILGMTLILISCDHVQKTASDNIVVLDTTIIIEEVNSAVTAFYSADTAKNAEGVIQLLWPDFTMLADGNRTTYDEVVIGSREFMDALELFHTEWDDLEILPLSEHIAVASFLFRDSIITKSGTLIQAKGPTTFIWQKRDKEWRLIFADADHYPVN